MRILLFAITILAYWSTAVGQTTTNSTNTTTFEPTTVEMGSGEEESTTKITTTIKTATPDPCAGKCGNNQECPGGCNCTDNTLVKSLNGYCAEPCDYNFVWCLNGEECSPHSNSDGYRCDCGPNEYREEESDTCLSGKFFGGQITFTTDFSEADNDAIEEILESMYNCEKAIVLNLTPGSIIVDYQLIYKSDSDATEATIQSDFESNTTCGVGVVSTTINSTYTINCTASLSTTTISGALCGNADVALPCDEGTARCTEGNGFMSCQCKDEDTYKKATPNAYGCLKIPCLSNSDCNSPFGSCNKDDGDDELMWYCDCMWGFEGASCQEPWGFVFTILTGAFGVILIIVLTVCICNMRKSKSTKDDKPEDMNLKNPFVDFQPGLVRAKVPNNMYSVSDTYDMTTRDSGGRNNGAYDHAHDDAYGKQTSTFQHEYQSLDNNRRSGASADYF